MTSSEVFESDPTAREPYYLDTALKALRQVDASDSDVLRDGTREHLGPYIRQVGRDIAALQLAGSDLVRPMSELEERTDFASRDESIPDEARNIFYALSSLATGYKDAMLHHEVMAQRAEQ